MKAFSIYVPIIFSVLVAIILWIRPIVSYDMCEPLITEFTTIGACVFGFVLTMFSLVIQSNSQVVERMRSRVKPFNRFVNYSCAVVFYSFFFTIFCYVISYGHFGMLLGCYLDFVKRIVAPFFLAGLIYYVWLVFYFLLVFFVLIKENDDKCS